jgi:hypothetical protein
MADSFLAVSEPTQAAGWRREIERILKDEQLRRTLAQSGRANARRFSSAAVSADLHRALRRATQQQV